MIFDTHFFICLLSAHLIVDFVLQGNRDVERKREFWYLVKHGILIAGFSLLLSGLLNLWWLYLVIGISHVLLDWSKVYFDRKTNKKLLLFALDQSIHIIILIGLTFFVSKNQSISILWDHFLGVGYIKVLVILSGLIIVMKMGSVVIGLWVKPLADQIQKESKDDEKRGFPGGGQIIGLLERGLILFFIMTGHADAVGFLIAAKSIFRFGELKEQNKRMEAEYVIIGTLYSFSWALFFSWLTKEVLKLII